jgi:hypothetical protein
MYMTDELPESVRKRTKQRARAARAETEELAQSQVQDSQSAL